MDIRKLKIGTDVILNYIDIHTDHGGWLHLEECLKEKPVILRSIGQFLGITKSNEVVLSCMSSTLGKHGIRIYIPIGCIVSVGRIS